MNKRMRVVVMNAALGPLDYRAPSDWPAGTPVPPGSIVVAPLGPREVLGVVWDAEHMPAASVPEAKLRPLREVISVPPLQPALRRLIEWTADYYLASPAQVARMAIPSIGALRGPGQITEYRLSGELPDRMTPKRLMALEALQGEQATIRELSALCDVSEAVLRTLAQQNVLEPVVVATDRPYPAPEPDHDVPQLGPEQAAVAAELRAAVAARQFAPLLLDGVTGSGKTEVYFEAIAEALRQGENGRQTLVLLPEIALTQNFLARFEMRFGVAPVAWHSALKQSERRRAWRAIALGDAKVIVGARSALFLPYADLAAIIVDEAHETSFKQEDGVRYNARDVAVMRGRFEHIPVVLASATPALESRYMAAQGIYRTLALPARHGGAQLPAVHVLNLLEHPPEKQHWIAPPLVAALEQRLEAGEQSLLFLNRRGFAPLTLCRTCGHRIKCPNCSAWMVEHRLSARLACHHCGHHMDLPEACPECGDKDALVACGPGVERIADEVARRFATARTALVTSDTMWSPSHAAAFVENMQAGLIDIIIGTQLVTKGFHFPQLTLVGVIDADIGLEGGDLRAAERSFQQIAQVSGRAGRGEKPGEVWLQTRFPTDPVIAALADGDREAFYDAETESRRRIGAPPFGRMAAIIISSEDVKEAQEAANRIGGTAPQIDDLWVMGPAPAPLSMLRGRHRYRLLVQAKRSLELQRILREWLSPLPFPRGVRVSVDVDPYSFT